MSNHAKHHHLDTSDQSDDQEPTSADEPETTENGDTPEYDTHVDGTALVVVLNTNGDTVETTGVKHDCRKCKVAEHPSQDDGTSESFVIVLVLLGSGRSLLWRCPLGRENAKLLLVLAVEIVVIAGDGNVDFTTWLGDGRGQLLRLVISLGTPCDIVGVAEGVDVEDVDVCWREQDVLNELEDVR